MNGVNASVAGRCVCWGRRVDKSQAGTQVAALEDSDLDSLPVRVVFEMGHLEMSISEIRQLAPGVTLPLARPLEELLDIVVNGKRIGRGSLVKLGEGLGVRVTRLNQDG
jgi:type III secretion protein Q